MEPQVTVPTSDPAIELIDVTKAFGPVTANRDVSFDVRFGEVHALVGENGAGKSTLMSIVAGLYRPDSGTICISGRARTFQSPGDAIATGIGMVYQHFMLVETMTVAENVLLGLNNSPFRLDTSEVSARLRELGDRFGLAVDPDAHIWQLSVGEQQRAEIVRLLYRGARILVLDEPTAVLTPIEAEGLIQTVRSMAADGFAIIFISHKLDEVLTVADRVTVLRRGESVATVSSSETDRLQLARLMVGRDLAPPPPPRTSEPGSIVLQTHDLDVWTDRGTPAVIELSLSIRAGEVLGIAGVAGNGQRELVEALAGLRPHVGGKIVIGGAQMQKPDPAQVATLGVAHIPDDRLATGLAGGADVETNAALRQYRERPLSTGPILRRGKVGEFADRVIAENDVVTPDRFARARQLSGGNQQKLIIGRELAGEPSLIIASYPTRGVDVAASEAIHAQLRAQRDRGAAVLLVSEDLDELRGLSDRIAVMVRGQVIDTISAAEATSDRIGMLMAGFVEETEGASTHV
jgi:ABC-type uncharacterized transport system ATPase subunit